MTDKHVCWDGVVTKEDGSFAVHEWVQTEDGWFQIRIRVLRHEVAHGAAEVAQLRSSHSGRGQS